MSNDFFNASGTPAQGSQLVTPSMRAEFAAVAAGFDKLPVLTGNAYEVVYINASGSAMVSVGGNGLLKMSTAGVPTVAVAGTDYQAPIGTISGIAKGNGANALVAAVAGTDYISPASISAATAATPNDADLLDIVDAGTAKKLSLTNLKAFLKTYFDTLYSTAATVASYVSGLIGSTIQARDATLDSLSGLSLVQGDILYATGADTLTRLAKGTANQEIRMNAGATAPEWYTPSTGGSEAYIYLREEQASATNGGTFTSGAWQKRTLNTEVNDAGGHASIASSVITLAAGTYRFRARAPAYAVQNHKLRLANTSDSSYIYGDTAWAQAGAQTHAEVCGRFTIATSKNFELQHYCSTTTATYGFGTANSFGVIEVYAGIEFWKEL